MIAKTFNCLQCGKNLGKIEIVDGVELLSINNFYCHDFRGICINCGTKIYFSVSSSFILKLVERSKQTQEIDQS